MSDTLEKLSPSRLAQEFAREYIGADVAHGSMRLANQSIGVQEFEHWKAIPDFAESVDAIMPYLMNHPFGVVHGVHKCPPDKVAVIIYTGSVQDDAQGIADTLPLAACYALIRHARKQRAAK